MILYEISEKMSSEWNAEVKAVVDTWHDYTVSLDQYKGAVIDTGVAYSKVNGGIAWVVDSSKAKGVFSQEIQKFIETDVFRIFAENGIKYFIAINSELSALTRMTVKQYSTQAGPHGVQMIETKTVKDAIMWLKENA